MKNSVELNGIICKEVVVSPERTDFLLLVESKGEANYIPCYTRGKNPYNLNICDTVKIKGCIKSRKVFYSALKAKLVLEIYAKSVTVLVDSAEV